MKYLVVVLVVVLVGWLLLRGRQRNRATGRPAASGGSTQPMVQCGHCGVHLPRAEALVDERGTFCTEAHRLAGPRSS